MESIQNQKEFYLYNDIKERTGGEIYIGVVGPVRTGKSTFIKRFMDLLVLPNIEDVHERGRAMDELPQSAAGKTIMTTEPKFVPKDAVQINVGGEIPVKIRLIDCVGYMVDGAAGHLENNAERMVKTPWFSEEIPFTKAAEMGTHKVIHDHSTIGIVVTCDGSFGDIPADNYRAAEERTIEELKKLGKPFVILLNTTRPFGDHVRKMAEEMYHKYQIPVLPVNCEQLKREDITMLLEQVLLEFPLTEVEYHMPRWVEMLPLTHPVKQEVIQKGKEMMEQFQVLRDIGMTSITCDGPSLERIKLDRVALDTGTAIYSVDMEEDCYYQMLSELTGMELQDEYDLMEQLKELSNMQKEYGKVIKAMDAVRQKGYGMVLPEREEIQVEDPVLIHQGGKYGVKLRSLSPSVHMIRADIETEIAPIVGSEEQAKDLIQYIQEGKRQEEGVWNINIFGKTIEELVEDGIRSKLYQIGEESQVKLQDTMKKIVNDSNGGLVCIII
ncbi:MAG: stage IV sporulation protein A [Lachnospiraceae bacterium]|nr:stage IV sporulation protein A [Lachnospiraceae bacterium]